MTKFCTISNSYIQYNDIFLTGEAELACLEFYNRQKKITK